MNTHPLPARPGSPAVPPGAHGGLARLAALLLQAVIGSVLLFYLAACNEPQDFEITRTVDSSDTRTRDLVMLSREVDTLSRFVDVLEQTGVVADLEGYGPWTVFAPVDRAFGRAAARLDPIRRGGLVDSLRMIVNYHIVRGRIDTSDVSNSRGDSLVVATVFEEPVTLHLRSGDVLTVGNNQIRARVLDMMEAQNGMLYIVNEVLILPPPDTTAQTDILFF